MHLGFSVCGDGFLFWMVGLLRVYVKAKWMSTSFATVSEGDSRELQTHW